MYYRLMVFYAARREDILLGGIGIFVMLLSYV